MKSTTTKRTRAAFAEVEAPPATSKRTRGAPTVTILHMCPPIVVYAQPSEFRDVVQKLTGLRAAATSAAEAPAPVADSPQFPLTQQQDEFTDDFYRPTPPSPPSSDQNPTASSSTTSCTSFQYNHIQDYYNCNNNYNSSSSYPASSPAYSNSSSSSIAEPPTNHTDTDDEAQFINPELNLNHSLSSSIYSDLHINLPSESAFLHQLVSPSSAVHHDEFFTVDDLMSCLGQYR